MRVYLFLHSHWDIQWYLSRAELRYYLFREFKRIINSVESGEIPVFTFDGQVMPILEFLEIYPEYRGRVVELVKDGRLEIGPWIAQPDTYLVNGESIARNLALGIIISESLGGSLKVGYLPDSFGHQPQIPQILRGAGITTYIFQRGYCWNAEEFGADFIWRSPNGSEVVAFLLVKGYCGGVGIGLNDIYDLYRWWSALFIDGEESYSLKFFNDQIAGVDPEKAYRDSRRFVEDVKNSYRLGYIPLPIGCDQYMPKRDLIESLKNIVEGVKSAGAGSVVFGLKDLESIDPEDLRDRLNTYSGELRCPRYFYILWGVPSTRIRIKQLNFTAERLIQRYLEPLSVILKILGRDPEFRMFRELWIKLIRSQFHDSICGTVTDHVAINVESELREVIEEARQTIYHYMAQLHRELSLSKEGESIIVFNPTPYRVSAVIELIDPREMLSNHRSIDVGGEKTPIQRIKSEHPLGFDRYIYIAEVPPLSVSIHKPSKELDPSGFREEIRLDDRSISTSRITVEPLDDGSVEVRDHKSGCNLTIEGVIDLRDSGDVYSYELENPEIVSIYRADRFEILDRGPLKASMKIYMKPDKPLDSPGLDDLHSTYSLYSNLARVDVDVGFINRSSDHVVRLRIRKSRDFEIYRDLAFMIDKYRGGEEYRDSELELYPRNIVFQYWIALRGPHGGFIIIPRGLHELFVYDDYIEITMLRSVGHLSKGDLKTRVGHAGPPLETPGAQELNRDFSYWVTIIPFTSDEWNGGDVFRAIESSINPPIAFIEVPHRDGDVDIQGAADLGSLLDLDPPLMISAVKIVERERGEGFVVRVFNPTSRSVVMNAKSGFLGEVCRRVSRGSIDERVLKDLEDHVVEVKPYSIETLIYHECSNLRDYRK